MSIREKYGGVYAAALTPLGTDGTPDPKELPSLLAFLARQGCHGALIMGTTGEGPSFAAHERIALLRAACQIRQELPEFRLFAGTGTPSLEETSALTRAAFDLGYEGVVVLPPYYFRSATDEALFQWFHALIQNAVPADGLLLGYHIPAVSGVPLSIELVERLRSAFPYRFAGLKDSSGDPEHAENLAANFGSDLLLFIGNDRLFSQALELGYTGCITALANLCAPDLRLVWEAHLRGENDPNAQERLNAARAVIEKSSPFPPIIKALIAQLHSFPHWPVRLPLLPANEEEVAAAIAGLAEIYHARGS